MFDYKSETTSELVRILDLLTADRVMLLSNGHDKVAEQNAQIIDVLIAELKTRGTVAA